MAFWTPNSLSQTFFIQVCPTPNIQLFNKYGNNFRKGQFWKVAKKTMGPHVTIDICRWKLLTAERSCFYPDGPSRSPDWDVLWWRLWPRNPFGDLKCQTKIILLLSKLVWMDIKCKCCQDLIVFMLDKSKDRKMDWASWLVSYYQFSQSHFPSKHWLVW